MKQDNFTIGELALQAKINVQTIRYYERIKLVAPSSRNISGYRFYTSEELKRILFIKNAQNLGFTLKEIQELLNLRTKRVQSCGSVQNKAVNKLKDVQDKISTLKKMEQVLLKLVSDCENRSISSDCPILEKMENT